jgi:hypothetical protein
VDATYAEIITRIARAVIAAIFLLAAGSAIAFTMFALRRQRRNRSYLLSHQDGAQNGNDKQGYGGQSESSPPQ